MTTSQGQVGGIQNGAQDALATTLHSVVRFLRTVRLRSGILLACLVVSGVLGALYYVTATRIYESTASLYIVQVGSGVTQDSMGLSSDPSRSMPTFRRLMSSEEVMQGAFERLPERFHEPFKELSPAEAAQAIQKSLSVSAAFNTNVLDLAYRSPDPKVACAVVAAVLSSYKSFMDGVNQGASSRNLETLEERLKEVTDELVARQDYRNQLKAAVPDLIGVSTDSADAMNVLQENISHLVMKYTDAREQTAHARATLNGVQEAIRKGEDVLPYAEELGARMMEEGVGLGNQNSLEGARINQQIVEMEAELTNHRRSLGPNHPTIRDLTARIETNRQFLHNNPLLRRATTEQASRNYLGPKLLQMSQQRLETAIQHEGQLLQQLNVEKSRAMEMNMTLNRIVDVDREIERLYVLGERLQENMDTINLNKDTFIRTEVATKPQIARTAVTPRLVIVGFFSIFLGTAAGLGIIWVLDIMDDRFRTPEELKLHLNTQVLSMVPALQMLDGDGFDSVICQARPNSTEAESFRSLRTNLDFAPGDTDRIVITSTEPGDGKTTISSNTAVAFAQSGRRTLIIDADMRRPGLSTLLDLRDDQGLSAILRSGDDLETAIGANLRATSVNGLDVISSGPRPVNPAELLSGERFANLLAWAETRYDQIIVDAPPVLAVSDPLIIGRLVDGVVLVVRPDKDRRRMVIRAAESLQSLGCQLLGVAVNHLSGKEADSYGYGYGYGYEYGNHDEGPEKHPVTDDANTSSSLLKISGGRTAGGNDQDVRKAA